jgi:hypothetical protein
MPATAPAAKPIASAPIIARRAGAAVATRQRRELSDTARSGTRCCSQVPNTTPTTAGTPKSTPSATCTFP